MANPIEKLVRFDVVKKLFYCTLREVAFGGEEGIVYIPLMDFDGVGDTEFQAKRHAVVLYNKAFRANLTI